MNTRQRGVFSEIVLTQDREKLEQVSTAGPGEEAISIANPVQKVPRAIGIKRRDKMLALEGGIVDTKNKIYSKSSTKGMSVTEGYYSKKREGVADIDPKVLEPYIPLKDHPPRKVIIDRQKKLYASLKIEDILMELGIDYSIPPKKAAENWNSPFNVPSFGTQVAYSKLPLEPFDDSEYD